MLRVIVKDYYCVLRGGRSFNSRAVAHDKCAVSKCNYRNVEMLAVSAIDLDITLVIGNLRRRGFDLGRTHANSLYEDYIRWQRGLH